MKSTTWVRGVQIAEQITTAADSLPFVKFGGTMKFRTLVLVGAAAALFSGQALAVVSLTLTQVAAGTVGPQSSSNPCIIAGTNCSQPAGFGYNNFTQGGSITSFNMYSTTPTASVADEGDHQGGTIDLGNTPADLRALFDEFAFF